MGTTKILSPFFLEAISSCTLQSLHPKMVFSTTKKELLLVAFFGQEKIHFGHKGFPLPSGLGHCYTQHPFITTPYSPLNHRESEARLFQL